jgi:hypothetical protein
MLSSFTATDLQKLIKIKYFTRTAAPSLGAFVKDGCTRVMNALCLGTIATGSSIVFVNNTTATSLTSGTIRNRDGFVILLNFNKHLLLLFLCCFLLFMSNNRSGLGCRLSFLLLTIYFNTVICDVTGFGGFGSRCGLWRWGSGLSRVTPIGTPRNLKEFVKVSNAFLTARPTL